MGNKKFQMGLFRNKIAYHEEEKQQNLLKRNGKWDKDHCQYSNLREIKHSDVEHVLLSQFL